MDLALAVVVVSGEDGVGAVAVVGRDDRDPGEVLVGAPSDLSVERD